jgi:hypothetical protein
MWYCQEWTVNKTKFNVKQQIKNLEEENERLKQEHKLFQKEIQVYTFLIYFNFNKKGLVLFCA